MQKLDKIKKTMIKKSRHNEVSVKVWLWVSESESSAGQSFPDHDVQEYVV